MGEGFLKFKQKSLIHGLIKLLAVALSLGLMTFGVLFLLFKREIIGLQPLFGGSIALGVALVAGGIGALVFIPTNKRLARRLDREFALKEKVQTMVAYQGDERVMVALQRADTEEVLRNLPVSELKFKKIWQYAVLGVLSLAIFVTSIFVPAIEHTPVDPPFNLSAWQKLKIENLIEYVERSDMTEGAKTYTVGELNDLIDALDVVTVESVMKTHVIDAIVGIDGKVDEVNSYGPIRKALGDTQEPDLVKLTNSIKALQDSASKQGLSEVSALFTYETFAEKVTSFNGKVTAALVASGYTGEDGLYASIVHFMEKLKTLADDVENQTAETLDAALNGEEGVGGIFTEFAVEAHDVLSVQKTNRRVSDYVINGLMEIFEITEDELPDLGEEELDYKIEEGNGKEDNPPPDDGGLGDGKTEYGSNDVIYDPEKGYVQYGTVLDKYFAQMNEQLINGTLPEDVEEFIRDYFASLYGSDKEE